MNFLGHLANKGQIKDTTKNNTSINESQDALRQSTSNIMKESEYHDKKRRMLKARYKNKDVKSKA